MPTETIRPFHYVRVVPSYGKCSAQLVWDVEPGFRNGNFIVFRSPDGINGWADIHSAQDILDYEDEDMFTRGRLDVMYYKVVLIHEGERYDSDVVSTFGDLTRRQFAGARKIMHLEWRQLRSHQAVKLFKVDRRVPCTSCVDDESGARVGTTKCETCYGTGFEGGFYPCVDTFMRQLAISGDKKTNRPDGLGTSDSVVSMVRLPAFPRVEQSDMLVYIAGDRRWLVNSSNVAYFNGVAPVATDASIQLMHKSDIRYKFPIEP